LKASFFGLFSEIICVLLAFSISLLARGLFKPQWLSKAFHRLTKRMRNFAYLTAVSLFSIFGLGLILALVEMALKKQVFEVFR
jgi:hypothetical protein